MFKTNNITSTGNEIFHYNCPVINTKIEKIYFYITKAHNLLQISLFNSFKMKGKYNYQNKMLLNISNSTAI